MVMMNPAALMLGRGGVALADSADASRCYPGLWPSPDAARQAFHRARRVTGPASAELAGGRHAPLRRATYQRAGAGKRRAALTYDPAAVPPAELRRWLEERVGPLARFAVEEAGEAPAPVPTGSGGASGPVDDPNHPDTAPAAPAPSTAPQAAPAARPFALPDRFRVLVLARRLEDARPKRRHGVRELDWQAWEEAARAAAGLPSAEWSSWRAAVGTVGAHQ